MPDAAVHNMRTISYPFLMGLFRRIGWRASWRVIGVRYASDLLYELTPEDLGLLAAEARRLRPRVVILNQRLPKKQLAAVRAAAPGARLVYWSLTEDLYALAAHVRRRVPEARGPALKDPRLLERIRPAYRRKVLNRAPWAADPVIEVIGGHRCSYLGSVERNHFYRDLGLPASAMGCSFCTIPDLQRARWNIPDPAAFAARQIAAACRQRPAPGAECRFDLTGFELWQDVERLARALIRLGVRGAELRFMPRLDELLRARGALERVLPPLAERGIAVRVNGLGVENFSPEENMRLHKGITAEQVHEAAAFLIAANARHPAHFRLPHGGLSLILFTPWTRLEDLRINLDNFERCPLIDQHFALGRRLMLFPKAPVTLLAERDGLLAKAGESVFYNAGCKNDADRNEIPWRFAHPEVAVLWEFARRISSDRFNIPADDPALKAIDAFVKDTSKWPSSKPLDPLPILRRAIDAVERHPGIRSTTELLERLRAS